MAVPLPHSMTSSTIKISFEKHHKSISNLNYLTLWKHASVVERIFQCRKRLLGFGLLSLHTLALGRMPKIRKVILATENFRSYKVLDYMYKIMVYNYAVSILLDYSLTIIVFSLVNLTKVSTFVTELAASLGPFPSKASCCPS
jgi:hypothetical protein